MSQQNSIKVWDLPVRIFHWSLVFFFLLAFITEDELLGVHTFAGYAVIGLVVFRLLWGLIGSHYARFSEFVRRPSEAIDYLKDVSLFRARRYLGHNPAGGLMILALLFSLMMTTFTGLVVYGSEEMAGPLAAMMSNTPHFIGEIAEETHEFFANFTLLLVVLHVVGVVIASLQHHENLVRSMITGLKSRHLSKG